MAVGLDKLSLYKTHVVHQTSLIESELNSEDNFSYNDIIAQEHIKLQADIDRLKKAELKLLQKIFRGAKRQPSPVTPDNLDDYIRILKAEIKMYAMEIPQFSGNMLNKAFLNDMQFDEDKEGLQKLIAIILPRIINEDTSEIGEELKARLNLIEKANPSKYSTYNSASLLAGVMKNYTRRAQGVIVSVESSFKVSTKDVATYKTRADGDSAALLVSDASSDLSKLTTTLSQQITVACLYYINNMSEQERSLYLPDSYDINAQDIKNAIHAVVSTQAGNININFGINQFTQRLTPKQAKKQLYPEQLRQKNQQIKDYIKSLCPKADKTVLDRAINSALSDNYAFFVGGNVKGLTGILGEIRAAYCFMKFFGERNSRLNAKIIGAELINGVKSPSDISFVNMIGGINSVGKLQVKNSTSDDLYGYGTINLKGDTANNFFATLRKNKYFESMHIPNIDQLESTLNALYAIQGFNIEYQPGDPAKPGANSKFAGERAKINELVGKANALFDAAVGIFSHLQGYYNVLSNTDKIIKGENLFYLVGSQDLIAASEILERANNGLKMTENKNSNVNIKAYANSSTAGVGNIAEYINANRDSLQWNGHREGPDIPNNTKLQSSFYFG